MDSSENQRRIYKQLPVGTYPRSVYASRMKVLMMFSKESQLDLTFPLAVKPDVGMRLHVQARDSIDRETYHEAMPVRYIIQE